MPSPPGSSAGEVPAPVRFSQLLKRSWNLYRASFRSLFVLFLPLGAAFFLALTPLLVLRNNDLKVNNGVSLGASLTLAFLTIVPVVIGAYAVATGSVLMTERLVGRPETAADAFRRVRPALGVLFTAGLAASLLSILMQLAIPPFAFFAHPLLYGPVIVAQVIALEGGDLRGALARAGRLSQGDRFRVFMYLFPVSLLISLLTVVVPGVVAASLDPLGNDVITLGAFTLAQIVVTAAIVPFLAAADLVAYFDLRARKEDLDLAGLIAEREAA